MSKMNKKIIVSIITILVLTFPFLACAQVSIEGIFRRGTSVIVNVISLLTVLAIAVFIWGIVRFISAAGNPEKLKTAKSLITWGLVSIFVLVSFVGIVSILRNTFGV